MELNELTPKKTGGGGISYGAPEGAETPLTNGHPQREPEDLENLRQENHELKAQLARLTNEYDLLRAEASANDEERTRMEELLEEKGRECDSRLQRLREDNYRLQSYLNEFEEKQRDLEGQLKEARAAGQAQGRRESLKGLRGSNSTELELQQAPELELDTQMHVDRIKNLETQLKAAESRREADYRQIERLNQKNGELEQELAKSRKFKRQTEEMKLRLEEAEQNGVAMAERLQAIDAQRRGLQEQLGAALEKIQFFQAEKEGLQAQQGGDEYEEEASYSFGGWHAVDENEVTRLQAENTELQAKLDQQEVAALMEETNAMLVQQLRAREADLVTQIYEKERELQEFQQKHEQEIEEMTKSVEIFGTSYATVFRKQSAQIQEQEELPTALDAAVEISVGPGLDLDPELEPGELKSGHFDLDEEETPKFVPAMQETEKLTLVAERSDKFELGKPPAIAEAPPAPDLAQQPRAAAPASNSTVTAVMVLPAAGDGHSAELDKMRAAYELEERLLSTAFYNYGLNLQRQAEDSRRTPTWLDRQRFTKNRGGEYEKHESLQKRSNYRII